MYIGNSPATGDNNSFKILDDISSYTLTFNGSSGSVVSVANDTITQNNHRFLTGQRVTYTAVGTAIGGLTSGNVYFIIKTDYSTFKLATSYSDAVNSIAINLTALGTGTHSINVAFDGFNTRFKTTYDNGTRTQISRAAQLQISINGVIQQPNDTSTPTNGFGIDLDSVVVFSAAPSASDVFWGNVLANNFPTFDISDNTIDSFTGTGSQVSFALSKTPANSQNVLVTINGVVQYPTDGSTVRSYSVDGNVLIFTDPPAAASVIQVRHIGFAGPTSSNVTGFYGRTGNVGLTTADAINVGSATIGVGAAGTSLLVQGNARITGILTIGTGSITLDGDANTITGISTISAPSISGVATFSTGPVLIGTGTSTGTAAQRLQVTGGGYFSGNLGVGSTNPQYRLDISGGDLNLPEGNNIRFGGNSRIQVATGGAQSLSLVQLLPHPTIQPTITELNAGGSEYTLRVAAGVNVRGGMIDFVGGSSTVNPAGCLVFRSGASFSQALSPERMRLFSTGEVGIGTTVLSGTSSQLLQVAGGAFVSGSIGIGTANPVQRVDIVTGVGDGTANESNAIRVRHSSVSGNTMTLQMGVNNVGGGAGGGSNNQGYGYLQSVYWGGGNNTIALNPRGGGVAVGSNFAGTALDVRGDFLLKTTGTNTQLSRVGFNGAGNFVAFPTFIGAFADNGVWSNGMALTFNTIRSGDVSGSTGLERMRISSSGFVGIATNNPQSTLAIGGTVTELYNEQFWNLVSQADIGIGASQISVNGMLGDMAFQNSASINVTNANVTSLNGGQLSGSRNMIINGSMVVNQRGWTGTAGTTTNNAYVTDRFVLLHSHDGVVSAGQTTMNSTVGGNAFADGFRNALYFNVTTADSSLAAGQYQQINQYIEGYNLQGIKKGTASAQPVTLSFWVRSTTTGTYIAELYDNDNIRQVSQAYTINTANTWEKKVLTFPADTTGVFDNDSGNSVHVKWWLAAGSTFSGGTNLQTTWESAATTNSNRAVGQVNLLATAGNDFLLTGVQLEVGSTATEFERRSFADELRLCQRYYQLISFAAIRIHANTTVYGGQGLTIPTTMRAAPTMTLSDTITQMNAWFVGNVTGTYSYSAHKITSNAIQAVIQQISGDAFTAGQSYRVNTTGVAGANWENANIILSVEL